MKTALPIAQIVVAILMMTAILLQSKGAGLGSAFGSNSTMYTTRRGVEKTLYITTIVLAALFFVLAFSSIILA